MKNRLKNLEITASVILLLIPLILIVFTGEVKSSISAYAIGDYNYLFVSLLTLSASVFIVDGELNNKRYNSLLGLCLFMVANLPYTLHSIAHYTFAGFFFLGSAFVISKYTSKNERWFKLIGSSLIVLALAGTYFNWYSLLIGETIAIAIIVAHHILEQKQKIN